MWTYGNYAPDEWCKMKQTNLINGQPIFVFIHGGGWSAGSIDGANLDGAEALTRLGAGVICGSYRLTPPRTFPVVLWDLRRLYNWIKWNYPDSPIYWAGTSAGANLSYFFLTGDSMPVVDAFIGFYGIYDIENAERDLSVSVYIRFTQFINPATWWLKRNNPINDADRLADTPVLLIHGEADQVIKPIQSEILHAALPHSKLILPSSQHSIPVMDHVGDIADFITGSI